MDMFVVSYVMYYAFTPDYVFKSVPPNGSEPARQTGTLCSDSAHGVAESDTTERLKGTESM